MKKWIVILSLVFLLFLVGSVSAEKTNATMKSGNVTFTSTDGKFSASTLTYVNGTVSISPTVRNVNGTLIWNVSSNQVSFRYNYKNDVLKETIILTRAKSLKFNIKPKAGTVLIPWFNGEYKIVKSGLSDTMTGLVISAPTGHDSKGYNIPMKYVQENNNLTLNYDTKVSIPNASYVFPVDKSNINWNLTTITVSITYPITIDPTWTFVESHYETTDGSYTVAKYNTTGTIDWTAPTGVTSVQYLIVAGGGGAGGSANYNGGGGAGGLLACATYTVTAGNNYTVIVGDGGVVPYQGYNSSFNGIQTNGGGKGSTSNTQGGTGGSGGGGGGLGGAGGTAAPSGQGNAGGSGVNGASASGGAGGGASAAGANGVANSNGATGGAGTSSSITGESICYAGGGGGGVESSAYNGGTATCGGGQGAKGTSGGSTSGTNALGGGGGGGTTAFGGSGVVIIRYLTPGGATPPVASFTLNKNYIRIPNSVTATDTSTNTPTSWEWSWGDGTANSTTQNPSHQYVKRGKFDIYLTATNAGGSGTTGATSVRVTGYENYY
jgi:hypothetical protein